MGECGKEREWPRVAIREETLACSRYGSPCAFLQPVSAHKELKPPMLPTFYASPPRLSLHYPDKQHAYISFPEPPSLAPSPRPGHSTRTSCDANPAQTLGSHRVQFCPSQLANNVSTRLHIVDTPFASSAPPASWVTSRF